MGSWWAKRFGDFQNAGDAGGVVDRAVVDVVARLALVLAQVVPVRHVDHGLVGALVARQDADHVARRLLGDGAVQIDRHPGVQRHRLEAGLVGLLVRLFQRHAGIGEQLGGGLGGDPAWIGTRGSGSSLAGRSYCSPDQEFFTTSQP